MGTIRDATTVDLPLLAQMNAELILEEGHSNAMNAEQLSERMRKWLETGEYSCVVAVRDGVIVGYLLFKQESDHIYIRQLFTHKAHRRTGVGSSFLEFLRQRTTLALKTDVLSGNANGISFWKSKNFVTYRLI